MLLNVLRRAAQLSDSSLSAVEDSPDIGHFERADGAAAEVEARIIEGGTKGLRAISVTPATTSGFNAFLDGIQRAQVRLHYGPIPIVYGYGAAVIRARTERRMLAHARALLEEREALFLPFRLIAPSELEPFGLPRDLMVDTSPPEGEPLPLFPPTLYARAAQAVDRWRESIERSVSKRWAAACEPSDWLLVNGTLTFSPELSDHPRAVGVIQSHRTRFFDGDDARVLFGLRPGERTSVFEPLTRRWTPVHSWYLRLRDPAGRAAFWGMVRVEIRAQEDSPRVADLVSSWLLAERTPLTLPHARWDRLLYPLHDCEQFLRARVPNV